MRGLIGKIMLGAALALASPALAQPTAADAPAVHWAPDAPSVIEPSDNANLSGWEAYKNRTFTAKPDLRLNDPILRGAIDLHGHYGPDTYARAWDAFEIARLAERRGMRAIVFKNHWSETAGLAYLVRKYSGIRRLEVFGSVALNTPVGGVNPSAVRYFAEVEGRYGRIVWMPTHDSEHEVKALGEARPYVRVSESGPLLPQVLEVLDLIKQHNLTLATGHVTPAEMLQIVREARARGVERIIITHPNLGPIFTDPTPDELRQAADLGGYVEIVASMLLGREKDRVIGTIRDIGPRRVFVSSDSGLVGSHNHPDALVLCIRILREAGFSEADLDLMFRRNPAWLIGLPAQ